MQLFKIGTFLMVIGAILLALFAVSVSGGVKDTTGYLLWGLGLFLAGYFLWRHFPAPKPNPSGRFRILKRVKRTRRQQDEEEE